MQVCNKGRVFNESYGTVCGGYQKWGLEATRLMGYFCSKCDVMFKGPDMMDGKR